MWYGRAASVAIWLLLLVGTPALGASTIYVDQDHPQANDSNPGTEALPLKTIDRAMAVVQPGDHVYIKGGPDADDPAAIYDRSGKDGLPIATAGTSVATIVIEAFPGDTVVLQGDGTHNGIALDHASYHEIRGLIVRNFNKAAEGSAAKSHILIEDCEFTQTYETGLRLRSVTDFTMRDVYVHHCFEAGISIREGTNVRLERVESSYNSDERGTDGDGDGFHTYGGNNFVLIDCVAKGNSEDGFDLNCTGVLINCVAQDHPACNIKLWRRVEDDWLPRRMDLINCVVRGAGETGVKISEGAELHLYNSVVYDNGEEGIAFRALSGNPSTSPVHSEIVNTIVTGNGTYGIHVAGTGINVVDADHSLYFANGSANVGLASDAGAISGQDPLFFGPDSGMFQLREGSPAIDAGRAVEAVEDYFTLYFSQGCAEDLDGDCRPSGAAWDIGCDERATAAGNTAPSFSDAPAPPPNAFNVDEGDTLTIPFSASDPQGDPLVFFLSGGDMASGMEIDAQTGLFSFTPTYDQGGDNASLQQTYDVIVGVTDQSFAEPADQTTIRIVVHNINRAPAYDGLEVYTLVEGRPWVFGISATDDDGDVISYAMSGTPSGMALDDSTGVLSWTPTSQQVGQHEVNVELEDGNAAISQSIVFDVLPQEPYQTPTDEQNIFYVDAVNGDDARNGQTEATAWKTIGKAATMLAAGQMVLIRSGTYHEIVTTGSGSDGHPIIFRAYPGETPVLDGSLSGSSPSGIRPGSHFVCDGLTFRNYAETIDLRASDGDVILVNCVIEDATDYGIYGFAGDRLRVENVVIRNIGDRGIYGGGTNVHLYGVVVDTVTDRCISMVGSSVDNVTVSHSGLSGGGRYGLLIGGGSVLVVNTRIHDNGQIGAELCARHNFLASSSIWNTSLVGGDAFNMYFRSDSDSVVLDSILTQSARYGLYVASPSRVRMQDCIVSGNAQQNIVVQDGATLDTASNVVAAGQTPEIVAIEDQSASEKAPLSFSIEASDPNGDPLTCSAIGLPDGASFDPATRTFAWTPGKNQAGTYVVGLVASDGDTRASEVVTITVSDVANHAPALTAIGARNVTEESLLSYSVQATDADGDALTYSCTSLPNGANFVNRLFSWIPTDTQAGTYSVTFTVSDGELTDQEKVTINVADLTDFADPVAAAVYPAADAIQVPVNPVIRLTVSDAGRGVDANTVTIRVDDQLVYSGNTASYQSAYGVCRRTGTQASYQYSYQPAAPFRFDEQVSIQVAASDLAGNAMTPYTCSFTTEMRVFGDNHPASWTPDDADKSSPATVRDSAGNIWLAYHAGGAGQRDIYISKLTLGYPEFAGPTQLTAHSTDQCFPAIAIDTDDTLYVVWQDSRRGDWDIYVSTSSDGTTWSTEARITDSDDNQIRPVIAIDSQVPNRAHVAWQDDGAGNQDIYVATSSNAFSTKTVSQVTTNASDQTDPAIAVGASNAVYLVWTDGRNGTSDIYGAASNSGPWTNVPVATGAGSQSAPVVATEADGTVLHFAWVDEAGGDADIRYASSNGMPGSPLAGTNIVDDSSGADQTAPVIVTAGSAGDDLRVFTCWVDERNVNANGRDTDLYFVDVSGGPRTNILVCEGGTSGSDQSEPAVGVDRYGYPYVLWTDSRNVTKYVYYAGSTYMAPDLLASAAVTASTGRTVGVATPASLDDVGMVIPAGACPHDVTVTIARVLNPQSVLSSKVLAFDFGPSGLQFNQPVTITIPYLAADYSGGTPVPCWYVSQTGTLSQQDITSIEVLDLSETLKALRFRTTHFTPYYLLEAFVDDDGDGEWDGDDGGGSGGGGGGGGGGGCSLSHASRESVIAFLLPYAALAIYMTVLRRRDRRRVSS